MRVAWSSDLHVDVSQRNDDLVPHLVQRVAHLQPDAFVVGGDVAERVEDVRDALERLAEVPCPCLYVPGNHDLFAERNADGTWLDSRHKLERALPEAVQAAGAHYIGLRPVRVGEATFVGTCGWFDGSLRDLALDAVFDAGHFARGIWRDLRAYDHGHVLWPEDDGNPGMPTSRAGGWASDSHLCDSMLAALRQQLQAVGNEPIIAVIHVLPFPELVVRGAFGPHGFYDAWLGSARLGDCLRNDDRVRLCISGHLHRHADVTLPGGLRAVARPIGDARKSDLSLEALAAASVGCIDLDLT